jgi:hypothetical protein
MRQRLFLAMIAIVTVAMMARSGHADVHQSMGRYLGIGWGDGYHSRNLCPPRHNAAQYTPATTTPWWATPAAPAEQLPHPAEQLPHPAAPIRPSTGNSIRATGPSLFRQPGEGTSITIQSGGAAGELSTDRSGPSLR